MTPCHEAVEQNEICPPEPWENRVREFIWGFCAWCGGNPHAEEMPDTYRWEPVYLRADEIPYFYRNVQSNDGGSLTLTLNKAIELGDEWIHEATVYEICCHMSGVFFARNRFLEIDETINDLATWRLDGETAMVFANESEESWG